MYLLIDSVDELDILTCALNLYGAKEYSTFCEFVVYRSESILDSDNFHARRFCSCQALLNRLRDADLSSLLP